MRLKHILCAALLLLAVSAHAEIFTTKTRSVAVFKNGLGFFMRNGVADLSDGRAVSDLVPQAALGTLWVGSPQEGVKVERLVVSAEGEVWRDPVSSIPQLLSANGGKRARIMCGDKVFEGTLPSGKTEVQPANEVQQYSPSRSSYAYPPVTSALVLLKTESGVAALDPGKITWVEILDDPVTERTVSRQVRRMRFEVSGAKKQAQITIGYMQKGITWVPAYMIDLIDDENAQITMQGLLANDVEDIDGADVSFVVGYPNFMYSDVLSPLGLSQPVTDFIDSLSNRVRTGRYAGAASALSNQSSDYRYGLPSMAFGYASTETPGKEMEDLYVYHVDGVTLKKGERAAYIISSSKVKYETLYEWKVANCSGVDTRGRYMDDKPEPEAQVTHKIRLTNSGKTPWTTASAMVMKNDSPLSQDKISYTPVGAYGDVDLTVAVDVKVKSEEAETGRQHDAIAINMSKYSRIDKKGTLTLKNFKSIPVKVEVVKTLNGEITASSDGKVQRPGSTFSAVNPENNITWEVVLKPGEEKVLTYSYFVYAN